jgi:hypothetical protein
MARSRTTRRWLPPLLRYQLVSLLQPHALCLCLLQRNVFDQLDRQRVQPCTLQGASGGAAAAGPITAAGGGAAPAARGRLICNAGSGQVQALNSNVGPACCCSRLQGARGALAHCSHPSHGAQDAAPALTCFPSRVKINQGGPQPYKVQEAKQPCRGGCPACCAHVLLLMLPSLVSPRPSPSLHPLAVAGPSTRLPKPPDRTVRDQPKANMTLPPKRILVTGAAGECGIGAAVDGHRCRRACNYLIRPVEAPTLLPPSLAGLWGIRGSIGKRHGAHSPAPYHPLAGRRCPHFRACAAACSRPLTAAVPPPLHPLPLIAGQIGYAICPMIARGAMLGPDQPVILHMLDIEPAKQARPVGRVGVSAGAGSTLP